MAASEKNHDKENKEEKTTEGGADRSAGCGCVAASVNKHVGGPIGLFRRRAHGVPIGLARIAPDVGCGKVGRARFRQARREPRTCLGHECRVQRRQETLREVLLVVHRRNVPCHYLLNALGLEIVTSEESIGAPCREHVRMQR